MHFHHPHFPLVPFAVVFPTRHTNHRPPDGFDFILSGDGHTFLLFHRLHGRFGVLRTLEGIHAWINESSEIFLSDNFGIESGDMYRMIETSDWLMHALYEIAKLEKKDESLSEIHALRSRIMYGIKEDLVDLVRVTIQGIRSP